MRSWVSSIAQLFERAVDVGFDCAGGAIDQSGDLRMVELLQPGKHEDFAMVERGRWVRAVRGKATSSVVMACADGSGPESGNSIRSTGSMGWESGGVCGNDLRPLFLPGGRTRRKTTFVALGVPVFEDAIKNYLNEILADRRLVGQAYKETVKPPVVAFEEFAEPPYFTGADGEHEIVIGITLHFEVNPSRRWRRVEMWSWLGRQRATSAA